MRIIIGVLGAIVVAACAGQPPAPPVAVAATNPTANAAAKSDAAANSDAAARKQGYRVVTKDGQKLYCSRDAQTGSHMSSTSICLTEAQWQRVSDASEQNLRQLNDQARPPAAGH